MAARILIISMPGDLHVEAIAWGLRTLGHQPAIWYWSKFPKSGQAALHIDREGRTTFKLGLDAEAHAEPFDTIWVRRRDDPQAMAGTHPDDVDIVLSESEKFLDNILLRLGHAGTRWVNHPYGDHRCRNKATQLLSARAVGFRIPDTLVGNDIDDVRAFVARHPGGVVFKAFAPLHWNNDDGTRTRGRTSLVTSAHLGNGFAVRACPGIYQEKLEKRHELRVTVIGDTVLASRIDSQRDGPTIDWRCEGGRGMTNLDATVLPDGVAHRCRALCRELGLAFGCIDLVVTPSDEIVFLEINCAGQFLFNELVDPGMPLLDVFCRYLAHGEAQADSAALSMARYQQWQAARQPSLSAA